MLGSQTNIKESVSIIEAQPEAAMLYEYTIWWYSWTGNWEDNQRDRLLVGVELNTIFKPLTLLNLMLQRTATAFCTYSILVQHQA